jgi:hypothetical protein
MNIVSKPSPALTLQFLLKLQGSDPGPLDGVIGPRTASALQAFQTAHNLPACTPEAALADHDTGPALWDFPNNPGAKAILTGMPFLGTTESPPDSNETQFGEWFGANGVKWCAIFTSYCFKTGSQIELCAGFKGGGVKTGKGCSYVPTIQNWLMTNGLTVEPAEMQPGDIIIYAWDHKSPEHIGLCCSKPDSGTVQSLEGNTSVSSNSNGGEVLLRTRNMSFVLAAGRIRSPQ